MLKHYLGDLKSTGNLVDDVPRYLARFGHQKTAEHCRAVAIKARELAQKYSGDELKAEKAAYLHDISAVIPNDQRIEFARSQAVEVLAEEIQRPMLIHQKLSVVLAKAVFGITDQEILSAIGCHTTLKANPSRLDKIVFLADKIAWDQEGAPPYLGKINEAIETSLDRAVLEYLNYLWAQRSQLKVIHPWLIASREFLLQTSTN